MIKKILVVLLGFLPTLLFTAMAHAEDITVSGNGASSQSNVNVDNNSSSNVNQDNTAHVDNTTNVTASTGNNQANSNTGGDASINTGDATVNSTIENKNINQSSVTSACCDNGNGSNVTISGNGSWSDNNVHLNNNKSTNVNSKQVAYINNKVYGNANTGYNRANDNTGGDVSISTGNINANDTIKNKNINLFSAVVGNGGNGDVSVKVSGNGSNSDNSVWLDANNDVNVSINNSAKIDNKSTWDLNTGYNDANDNTGGDVSIATGDITFDSTIENGPLNVSIVDIECCEKANNNPTPPPVVNNPPSSTTTSNNPAVGGVSSTSSPAVLAAVTGPAGKILPATGGTWMFMLTIGSVLMFFMGWYLRLRSGRSPNFVKAA